MIVELIKYYFATLAQLVEQLICNQQVVGSTPTGGSIFSVDNVRTAHIIVV